MGIKKIGTIIAMLFIAASSFSDQCKYSLPFDNVVFFKYEAEQEGEISPVDPYCSNFYYYITRDNNCGDIIALRKNEYAWRCEEAIHDAGYAVKDIYYKWSEGDSMRLDHQISYKGKMKDLYVIFNMSLIPDVTIADTARICEVHAVCDTSGTGDYYTYTLVSTDTTYDTILRKEDFDSSGNFTQFEYKIAIKDVSAGNLLIPDECTGTNHLKNFNPRVYWFDKGDLWIDNITIEDDIYKRLKNEDYDIGFRDDITLFIRENPMYELNSHDISLQ